MSALLHDNSVLDALIREKGLEQVFAERVVAIVDCRKADCLQPRAVKLNRRTGRVHCEKCGLDGQLSEYLTALSDAEEAIADNVIDGDFSGDGQQPERPAKQQYDELERQILVQQQQEKLAEHKRQERAATNKALAIKQARKAARQGKLGERIIMTLLALIFLGAGLAAAALSGFANFQAFSASVTDPVQGQVWGWSGVIASVGSFGGFTFFWWHTSARRYSEGFRALVFALAGAATSIAGTAMFMTNNNLEQQSAAMETERTRVLIEAQITDWTAQIGGIPASTRSVEGLKAYIAGVEAAGRTHQKPYRDAQNELGLAERRANLEANVAAARAQLLGNGTDGALQAGPERKSLPSWFFALMLEVFSSQGTSIAFVSLLLLYGARAPTVNLEAQPDLGS